MFAQRYALFQPESVRAIAAGQCGGAMTLPESIYTNGAVTQMEWPVGVSDFSALVGKDFDEETYREVSQFIYIGDEDDTNSTLWGTGELWRTQAQIDFLNSEFGDTDPVRIENQAAYMAGLGYDVTFKMYPGVGHQVTNSMIDDTFDFFQSVKYPSKLYLPMVAHRFPTTQLPIVIDGDGEEWQAYSPLATDAQGDTTGGPGTDVKSVYSQEDEVHVYIMVDIYDPPMRSDGTIELNMDIIGQNGKSWWLHTNIGANGSFSAWTDLDENGDLEEYPIEGEVVAWDNVMEIKIPLSQLDSPQQTVVTFVNFWTHVDGEWQWVDILTP